MGIWRADIQVVESGKFFEVKVVAGSGGTAKDTMIAMYNARQIHNLREISSRDDGGRSLINTDSVTPMNFLLFIGSILVIAVFAFLAPFLLMALGGYTGFKLGEICTGQSIERFAYRSDRKGFRRLAITVLLSLLLGGVGFWGGIVFWDHFFSDSEPKQEVIDGKSHSRVDWKVSGSHFASAFNM